MSRDTRQELAFRLHAGAIRLLRIMRREGDGGISGPGLSALAAIAASGPMPMARLAAGEQVSGPTMTRIVDRLVEAGLVERLTGGDRRQVRVAATEAGHAALREDWQMQLTALRERMTWLAESELRALDRGVQLLERLTAR